MNKQIIQKKLTDVISMTKLKNQSLWADIIKKETMKIPKWYFTINYFMFMFMFMLMWLLWDWILSLELLQQFQELLRRSPPLRISDQTAPNQFLNHLRQLLRNRWNFLLFTYVHHYFVTVQTFVMPWRQPCRQLQKSTPQTPNIRLYVIQCINYWLRCHPMRSPFLGLAPFLLIKYKRNRPLEIFRTTEIT